jgi:hypothetical protein
MAKGLTDEQMQLVALMVYDNWKDNLTISDHEEIAEILIKLDAHEYADDVLEYAKPEEDEDEKYFNEPSNYKELND